MSTLRSPVLVIGGCGCLGYHIVKQLVKEPGFSSGVAVFDINTRGNRIDGVKYLEGSVSSRGDILRAIRQVQPSVIFHMASPKLMVQANSRQLYTEVNIDGTALLLESIKEVGVTKALIYTSSPSVIHDNMTDLINVTEDVPLCFEPEQTEYYTHTKAVAEQMINAANRKNNLLTTIIRATMLFGEVDATSTPQMVENARAGRGNFQIGKGDNIFDFTYIENTAYAHILAAKALVRESTAVENVPENIKVNGEAFVITNDEPWPFWDYTRAIGAAVGHSVKREDIWIIPASVYYGVAIIHEWAVWVLSLGHKESLINRRMVKYLTMTRTFDISKAKQRLGYKPQVSMQDGIRRAVDFYVTRHPEKG